MVEMFMVNRSLVYFHFFEEFSYTFLLLHFQGYIADTDGM